MRISATDRPTAAVDEGRAQQLLAAQPGQATGRAGAVEIDPLLPLIGATYAELRQERDALAQALSGSDEQRQLMAAQQQQLAAAFRTQTQRFKIALDYMSQGLCLFDRDKRLVVSNRRYAEIYGLSPDQIVPGMTLRAIVELRGTVGSAPIMSYDDYIDFVPSRDSVYSPTGMMVALRCGRTIAIRHQPLDDGGYVATHEDITERLAAEAQIAHMALHDALTGLPNRLLFRERLQQALDGMGCGRLCAILYIDLDYFKTINDTLGHPIGDSLLRAVTERLHLSLRQTDTVARLGGDEFAIVQGDVADARDAANLAERLVGELGRAYDLDGHRVVVGASVGIALAPQDGTDPDLLMKHADLALYSAKLHGRSRYCFFHPEMAALAEHRRSLQVALRQAFAAQEFVVHYQPLVQVGSGRMVGFEALLRWQRLGQAAMSAAEFIPLAEEIGLGGELDRWLLAQACADAADWPDTVRVAVNLGAKQFSDGELVAAVAAALDRSGLPAGRLELEVTETAAIQDPAVARTILRELKGLGVRLALADFGTRSSSLRSLQDFPFDRVKIDHAFIAGLGQRPDSAAIVRAVTGLCASLGIVTTAEGVETEAQLAVLRTEGCNEAEGPMFGAPYLSAQISQASAGVIAREAAPADAD
jgi:diguanylate cyclase (GGDEF)-like protein